MFYLSLTVGEDVVHDNSQCNCKEGAVLDLVSSRALQDKAPCDGDDVGHQPDALAKDKVTANGNLADDGEDEDEVVNVLPHGTYLSSKCVSLHLKNSKVSKCCQHF